MNTKMIDSGKELKAVSGKEREGLRELLTAYRLALTAFFCLLVCLVGCKKSDQPMIITAANGNAKIEIHTKEVFAEDHQEITFSGKEFSAGSIPANTILAGNQKTVHPEIKIEADGILPKVSVKVPKMLPLGKQELKIGELKFAEAVNVKPVQLEYMMWGRPDELDTVSEYIRRFHEKFPNIKVKILHVPQAYDDKLKTLFAAKTPPDVMYMGLERFPSFVNRGVFLNLQPYVDRDNAQFKKEDFFPNLMEIFKYKGDLYGIPKDFTPFVLYYNKTLFDKAGVNYPNENWTWKDFLDAAKKLTRDFDGDGKTEYGFVLETWLAQWLLWVWQNGGEIIDRSGTKWLLGDSAFLEKNAEAIQFLADLIWKEGVAPKPQMTGDMGFSDMFKTGKIGMCIYGRWMCMDFKNIKDFEWDVAVLPKKMHRASTLAVVCYAIAAQTKHPEAAWQLIQFLMSPEGQIAVAESGHAIPSRKSVASSKHFLEAKVIPQKINAKVFLESVNYARPVPANAHWAEIDERINREMELVFLGKMTAKEAILKMQKDIEKILAKPVEQIETAKR